MLDAVFHNKFHKVISKANKRCMSCDCLLSWNIWLNELEEASDSFIACDVENAFYALLSYGLVSVILSMPYK